MILPTKSQTPYGEQNVYIIKSFRDGKNLAVKPNGWACVDSDREECGELWLLEKDSACSNGYYFYSCLTNKVLQCSQINKAVTENTNRQGWELLVIEPVFPDTRHFKCQPRLQ